MTRRPLGAVNGRFDSSKQQLCVYFAPGHCRHGSSCRYSHKLPAGDSFARSSSSSSQGGARHGSTRDPDMRQCNTIDDLVQLAYDHLDIISPRGIAAFWSLLVKHLHNQRGNSRFQLSKQLDEIFDSTMESIGQFSGRDLATTALGLAKVMKQSHGQRADLHRILHNLLIGVNSERKQCILDIVAKSSGLICSEIDARSLSNLIYSFGLAEYIPKIEDGRTIFDVLALEAMSKLKHFNSQNLSNMLWSYAKIKSSNSVLFKAVGDSIVGMNDVGEFKPQELSIIIWAYATAGESHPKLFSKLGDHIASLDDLGEFKPQELSNIIWAYATAGEAHPKLFSKLGDHVVSINELNAFKPQDFSNIVWAYATTFQAHPQLFSKVSDHIVAMRDLSAFKPQHLSNIVWSYATAGESHPKIYKKFGDHVVALRDLGQFKPQALSNIVWSYATAGESHPRLFSKLGDHIVTMHDLNRFDPQALSNIIWAFATTGQAHPNLYKKLADHIASLDDLSAFLPQHFSNILWSYATAGESHPQLFSKLAHHIVTMHDLNAQALSNIIWAFATSGELHPLLFQKLAVVAIAKSNDFTSQNIANLLWAYATVGIFDPLLFTSFAPAVQSVLGKCSSQALANIAWSYAVANINDHLLFNKDFIDVCQAKANDFRSDEYSQLHQCQLWQDELKSGINLPPTLSEKCRHTFELQSFQSSNLQNDVISELSSIGLCPEEEVLTPSGYRLDALVEVNGTKVGIEVDGPYHFMNQEPTGSTILKRRQVSTLDSIQIVSVPYWEWNQLEKDRAKKQDYMRSILYGQNWS